MARAFDRLAEARDEDPVLHIEHRRLRAVRRAGGVVWFDFRTLCGGPRSQNDYLELASRFHTVLLSDVPAMPPRLASEARRFTWLVDVLYDRRVKLILSAAVPPEQLYTEGPLAHEFPRTVSRLHEMQSAEYLALARGAMSTPALPPRGDMSPVHLSCLAGGRIPGPGAVQGRTAERCSCSGRLAASRPRGAHRRAAAAGPHPRVRVFAANVLPLAAAEPDVDAERQRIAAERAVAQAHFDAREEQCQKRFAVTACVDRVRAERLRALDALREQELR
jgi:hypothetical protein